MNYYKKMFLWLFLCLGIQGVTAQNFTPFEEVVLLKNDVFTADFEGYQPQVIQKSNATTRFLGTKPHFQIEYTPDSNYTGVDTLIVEYSDSESWFRSKIKYLSLVMNVVASTVDPVQDYFQMNAGDTLNADVLSNDVSSVGILDIKALPIAMNGQASVQTGLLQFIPDAGFTGITTVQYQVCDSLGTCDFEYVTIQVLGSSFSSDTIDVAVKQDESITLPLPKEGFTILDSSREGSLEMIGEVALEYVPAEGYYGLDSFQVELSNGDARLYRAQVLERKDKRNSLVDDVAYTEINQEVWIDVQKNDVTDNFKPRTIKQPGLGSLFYVDSVGMYRYVPPLDIESIESFDYGLKGGKIDEKATATVYINDGHPDVRSTYRFTTPVDESLVIRYDLPIDGHEFKLKTAPPIGQVDIFNTDTTVVVECDSVSGSHFIVFKPGNSFLGPHVFTLEHCVKGTSFCVDVDIIVETTLPKGGSCYCMDDCVWSGDINYDGRVDMKDLLPLAHHLGLSGSVRSSAKLDWKAQRATDWNQSVMNSKVDLKHADTDGNGKLNASDTLGIAQNYHREHSMVPQLVGPSRSFAWYLEPRFDTVKAGELAVIDVVFGNRQYPIEDMEGVAYTVNFSPHVKYDSSSLQVTHHPGSFLTSNSPFLGMDVQPKYRQIDVGLARTSGTDAHGFGVINTVEIIVDEDLSGFKSSNGIVPMLVTIDNIQGISSNGEQFSMPGTEVIIYVDYGNRPVPFNEDRITVWPNPAQGVFNVHLNGDAEMQSAQMYSMDGQLIETWKEIHPDKQRFIVDYYQRGAYLLRIKTTQGVATKKIQLLGHQ